MTDSSSNGNWGHWLWPGRIPSGCLTVICGRPGVGKSFMICDLAARISAGLPLPDGAQAPVSDTLLIGADDDPAQVLRPRCETAGADLRRIRVVTDPAWTLAKLDNLKLALDGLPEVRLLVLDPVVHYLWRLNQRAALGRLATLAEERRLAILLVSYGRKTAANQIDDSMGGWRSMSALPHMVHYLVLDPDAEARRLFVAAKSNLAPAVPGLAFRIGGQPPKLQWEPRPVDLAADDVIRRRRAWAALARACLGPGAKKPGRGANPSPGR